MSVIVISGGGPVREHVRLLRAYGASYREIARAAGLGYATIWEAVHLPEAMTGETVSALMAVQPRHVSPRRIPAGGSMWRLRSLQAMSFSAPRIARALGISHAQVSRLIGGEVETVTPELYRDICHLWGAWWDKRPAIRNQHERSAASKAMNRAARSKWPCPAGLDEDDLDIPGYKPRHPWRHATGTGIADDYPLGLRGEAA
jgi:plasmid maintenance system antidote protein VapI